MIYETAWALTGSTRGADSDGRPRFVFPLQFVVLPTCRGSGLDGRIKLPAPLVPRGVIVAHAGVVEQVAQHEPGVGGAHADHAIGDHVLVRGDPMRGVQ